MIGEFNTFNSNKGVPKHQSIGRNGSFWLPKANSDNSFKKTNAHKSSNKNSQNINQQVNLNPTGKSQIAPNFSKKPQANFAKTIHSASNKENSNNQISPGKDLKFKQNFNSKGVHRSFTIPLVKKTSQLLFFGKKTMSTISCKEESKPSVGNVFNDKSQVSRDSGKENQGKKRNNSGMINANYKQMDSEKNDGSNQVVTDFKFSNGESSSVKVIDIIQKSLIPHFSYLNKFSKKIIRFAIDLPRGEKLGVRIEKSNDSISLCFIAPESIIREMMGFCKNDILSKVASQEMGSIKINIFSDYKEMDEHFSKAA